MASEEYLKAYKKAFGKHLQEIRKAKGSTLSGMDANTKFDSSNYHKYEMGNGNPTLETLVEIAEAFGIHPKELFEFDFNSEKNNFQR